MQTESTRPRIATSRRPSMRIDDEAAVSDATIMSALGSGIDDCTRPPPSAELPVDAHATPPNSDLDVAWSHTELKAALYDSNGDGNDVGGNCTSGHTSHEIDWNEFVEVD